MSWWSCRVVFCSTLLLIHLIILVYSQSSGFTCNLLSHILFVLICLILLKINIIGIYLFIRNENRKNCITNQSSLLFPFLLNLSLILIYSNYSFHFKRIFNITDLSQLTILFQLVPNPSPFTFSSLFYSYWLKLICNLFVFLYLVLLVILVMLFFLWSYLSVFVDL